MAWIKRFSADEFYDKNKFREFYKRVMKIALLSEKTADRKSPNG
jgi:hypothetical protein